MSNQAGPKYSVRTMATIGVMAAVVFAVTKLYIPIPTAIDNTRLHLGNVMCLLSGLLLGPVPGGLAAGIGSLFFDLTDPLYVKDAPFTFVFKFLMAFVCGKIAHGEKVAVPLRFVGATAGAFTYVALYLSKNFVEKFYLQGLELETVLLMVAQKGAASAANGVIAVIAAVPLYMAIRKALRRANVQLIPTGQH